MSKLTLFWSVMNAGKTTHLLQTEFNYRELGYTPLIIKPTTDNRDGDFKGWGTIKSRLIDEKTQCLYLKSINKKLIYDLIKEKNINVVFVDEVQFFNDEDAWVLSDIADELEIPVLCYGLKVDSNGNLFSGIKQLFALADSIKEIKQICKCGHKATMHLRLVNGEPDFNGKSIAIDGKDKVEYKSVCRKCWKEAKNNLTLKSSKNI